MRDRFQSAEKKSRPLFQAYDDCGGHSALPVSSVGLCATAQGARCRSSAEFSGVTVAFRQNNMLAPPNDKTQGQGYTECEHFTSYCPVRSHFLYVIMSNYVFHTIEKQYDTVISSMPFPWGFCFTPPAVRQGRASTPPDPKRRTGRAMRCARNE